MDSLSPRNIPPPHAYLVFLLLTHPFCIYCPRFCIHCIFLLSSFFFQMFRHSLSHTHFPPAQKGFDADPDPDPSVFYFYPKDLFFVLISCASGFITSAGSSHHNFLLTSNKFYLWEDCFRYLFPIPVLNLNSCWGSGFHNTLR
jgi:hypothetical protein